jgi:hypothetical protein
LIFSRTSSAFEVKMVIEKLNRHKASYSDQIPAEVITAGGGTFRSEGMEGIDNFIYL